MSASSRGRLSSPISEISSRAALPPLAEGLRRRAPTRRRRVLVKRLQDLVSDRPADQRLGLGSDRLRLQLVLDEPAVGAGGVFLERRGAEELDLPHPLQDRIELQGPGPQAAVLGPRPERGLRSRQLDLAGRRIRFEDGLGQATPAGLGDDRLVALLQILGERGRQQVSHLVDEGRARGGASLVIGAPPGEPEPLLGAREADREEVAVLDLRLLSLGQGERPAGLVGEQRATGVAAREVPVLHRADEHVGDAPRPGPVRG